MSGKYILHGKTPVKCEDIIKWANWFENTTNRIVDRDALNGGKIIVSTVFIGIDHNFLSSGPPILFETMIFGGERDGEQIRYSTWDEAEKGHKKIVDSLLKHTQ